MGLITVLAPHYENSHVPSITPAGRTRNPEAGLLTLIDNGKPNARALLARLAEELVRLLPITGVELHSKPSAAKAIDQSDATRISARSRFIVSGLGD